MEATLKLSIKTPCKENFKNFTKTAAGGFCSGCNKEVIDFTKMSKDEILTYFKNSTSKTCGMFNKNQLGIYSQSSSKIQKHTLAPLIAASLITSLSAITLQAQNITEKDSIAIVKTNSKVIDTIQPKISLRGVLFDDNNLPLPGASLSIKNSTIYTNTDFDGNFTFKDNVKIGDTVIASYVGYKTLEYVVKNNSEKISLNLENDDSCNIITLGEVSTEKIYKSKKSSFLKRLFSSSND